jgi:hypothetical protein
MAKNKNKKQNNDTEFSEETAANHEKQEAQASANGSTKTKAKY